MGLLLVAGCGSSRRTGRQKIVVHQERIVGVKKITRADDAMLRSFMKSAGGCIAISRNRQAHQWTSRPCRR